MKVRNVSKAVIYIGDKVIKPGEEVELSKEEAEMSGVKVLIESKELEVRKERKKK